jgi:penicillin-binding protein 1C
VLGTGSVRLTELANAYACLARGGAWLPLRGLEDGGAQGRSPSKEDADASRPEEAHLMEGRRVFSEGACWLVAETLSGGERAQDAVGHVAEVGLPRFAWKTGTSSGFRDAWTVAWNPEYVVAVWCGYKSGRCGSDSLVGKKVAAPVAWEIIRSLYPAGGDPWFARPEEVVEREVCAVSGRVPGPLCERRVKDLALRQRSSYSACPVHVRDAQGRASERWPAEVTAFREARAGAAGGEARAAAGGALKIVAPAAGAAYRLVDGMAAQKIVFKVAGAAAGAPLYWFRNDALEGTAAGGEPFFWTPQRGTHRFVCADVTGASATVTVTVE